MSDFALGFDILVNMSETDLQLLTRYTHQRAEDAFAEIVRRHIDLVHSAALRQVRSPELAEEVAQAVFIELARQARLLPPRTVLAAWLYHVTRRRAIDVVRREAGRRLREQTAQELQTMNATAEDWTHIEPLLDDAMDALEETDRLAVLLRYFQNKPLHEVGQVIGVTDDAAQKRVSRAVERLREFFTKRGVSVGASGLVVVISANAVQAAPVGLIVTISTAAALAGTTLTTTATATVTKAIAMTTLQKTLVAATLAAAVGMGIYEGHQASTARAQAEAFRKQHAALTEQMDQLIRERDEAANRVAALRAENEGLSRQPAELLRLRAELTALRNQSRSPAQPAIQEANDPTATAALAWVKRVKLLKERFEQFQGKKTPEIQFLTEQDWLNKAAERELDTDDAFRQSMSNLRIAAKGRFAHVVNKALKEFARDNNQQLPTELSQLAPYLAPPADSILDGYQMTKPGWIQLSKLSSHNAECARAWAIVDKGTFTPEGEPNRDGSNLADPDFDAPFVICQGNSFGYAVDRPSE